MKRVLFALLASGVFVMLSTAAWAAGPATQLFGYAVAGANPRVVFIITDANQNGVKGVAITAACTTGTLDVYSGTTAADGTFTVNQSGAALGSHITATCGTLTNSPLTITSANAAAMVTGVGGDPSVFWFDESRRLANAFAVTKATGVLTSTSTFWFYPSDNSSSNGHDLTISQTYNQPLSQTSTGPAQVEVYQGTYTNGDSFSLYDAFSGHWVSQWPAQNNWGLAGQGTIFFAAAQPSHFLNAYAVDGASPTVCAVVTDTNGVGVSGVTVSVAATSGTFPLTSDVTGDSGRVYFYQQGGSLGDTITVSCSAFSEISPVQIITHASQPVQTTDKLFSWFSRKSRRIYTAAVTRSTNVLVTSAAAPTWPANYFNVGSDPDPSSTGAGVYVDQTSQQPAIAAVSHGSTVSGDLFRMQASTINRYSTISGGYSSEITFPANETNYLVAFASGGANPTIWAAVTDINGNAVQGVTVNFSVQGTGTLATASGPTSWNGMITNTLTGAAAEGNTITVTSAGLGTIVIVTSDSQAVASSDRVYSWYDPATHKIIGAVVTMATNVMTNAGTSVGGSAVKKTAGNNIPTLSYSLANEQNTQQSTTQPFIGHAGFGTINAGDFIRITQNTTSNQFDTHIIAAGDPAKFLVAFAKGGGNPDVYAVVMDNKGNGLEGESVTFSAAQGTMSLNSTVTGYGGYVVSTQSGGALGNTITVSAPGLTPVIIYTAAAPPAGGHGDNGVAWYDASRMTIWGISFDEPNHVILASQSWYDWNGYPAPENQGPHVYNTGDSFKVNRWQPYDMTRKVNPFAQWSIAFGSANVGDECWVDLALIRTFIHLNTVKPSYLHAYANPGANPSVVKAIVTDAHGVGLSSMPVNFSSSAGSMGSGPSWTTGLDGSVNSGQSGGALGDVLTVSSAGYPDVQIQTNASGGVQNNSSSVFWFDPNSRRLNSVMLNQPWHNVIVTTAANILFAAVDQTANNKTVSISGPREDFAQSPSYGFVAPGTTGAGDQIWVQNNSTWFVNAGLLTLPADLSKYLWAFAAGGANPKVWAAVTDANGNGISGVPVHFTYPTAPLTVNLVTDATGVTTNAHNAILTNNISITADGVSNTINVTVAAAAGVDTYTRTEGWYDVPNRTGYGAFVSVQNNVMASGTSATFTPVDTTPNGLTFALGASTQQTAVAPSSVLVNNGTQGQGDIIQFDESTAAAAPDMQLSINVPASGIYSSLTMGPNPAITGQYISVTMTVFNNGTQAALSVSPTALAVIGGAAYFSGPTPPFAASIPGGGSQNFIWTYATTAPGGVTLTGQAFGVDSYTLVGLTSTATNSNPILVRNPLPPVLTSTLAAPSAQQLTNSYVYVTMTVTNNSAAEVGSPLNVSPTALTLAGSATPISGPVPPNANIAGQGGQAQFVWEYQVTAPTGVTFTGQAYTLNPFDHTGVTSTATGAFVAVRNPLPPVLSSTLAISPTTQITNGYIYVTMTVTNNSAAEVGSPLNVSPTALTLAGSATPISGPVPLNANIPGQGGQVQFVWEYQVTAPTGVTFTGQAYTLNPFDHTGVTSTATNAFVAVRNPLLPVLTSALVTSPGTQVTNGYVYVTMTVTNSSAAEVGSPLNVSPTALTLAGSATPISGPVPPNANIAGQGGQAQFVWEYQVTAPTSVTFTGQAYTLNPFDLSGVTSTATSALVGVRNPDAPNLAITSFTAGPVSPDLLVGQYISVTMTVTNNSDADVPNALTITPLPLGIVGGALPHSGPFPAQAYVGRGNSCSFWWDFTATSAGNVSFGGQAATVNPFNYLGVTSTATFTNSVVVRNPHAPSIVPVVSAFPLTASVGQYITVSMTVTNNSDLEVASPLTVTALPFNGLSGVAWSSGPTPVSQTVAAGSFVTFNWTYLAATSGNTFFNGHAMVVNPFDDSGVTVTATAPVSISVQTAASISAVLAGPATAEQFGDFTVTMTVTNNGQATAVSVSPTALTLSGTNAALLKSGPTPASASITSGSQQVFTWTYTAAGNDGIIQFSGQAKGLDANSNSPVATGQVLSGQTNVFQGALDLEQVTSPSTQVYRGQKNIPVTMQLRNTSLQPVTITAATINFNGLASSDFTVVPNTGNPQVVQGQSDFSLQFTVAVGKNAPLGNTLINGGVVGASAGRTMTTLPAPLNCTWNINEAVNKLRQNYPNPFYLSKNAFTTFDYYVKEDVPVTLKVYNLAGELVAVLVDGSPGVGHYTVQWNGHNGDVGQTGKPLGSGVYLAVFQTGSDKEILKVVVIK